MVEAGHSVIEEAFVAVAEVAFAGPLGIAGGGFILHTSSAAVSKVFADDALIAEIFFGAGEGKFLLADGEFFEGSFEYIAEPPFRLDEKIAGKGVAIMLDDDVGAALGVEGADCVFASEAV